MQSQVQEDNAPETIKVTPHKIADYQSPKKKLSSRRKKRNVSQWKANKRKKAITEGREYITIKKENCTKKKCQDSEM